MLLSERFHFLVVCSVVIDENKPQREREEFMHSPYMRARNNRRKGQQHQFELAQKLESREYILRSIPRFLCVEFLVLFSIKARRILREGKFAPPFEI